MPIEWTKEKLATLTKQKVENLRENALIKSNNEIVALCNADLETRKPPKPVKTPTIADKGIVIGYHFVCRPQEKGVIRNSDGTAWSGTWVVSEDNAEKSLVAGAYVALHLSHAEPSYLKGNVKAWRRTKREKSYAEGQEVKTQIGTDFLLEITDDQIEWRGEGTVERSYVYAPDLPR